MTSTVVENDKDSALPCCKPNKNDNTITVVDVNDGKTKTEDDDFVELPTVENNAYYARLSKARRLRFEIEKIQHQLTVLERTIRKGTFDDIDTLRLVFYEKLNYFQRLMEEYERTLFPRF